MAVEIVVGDCIQSLRAMPAQSVHCCITSPPYFGLRDYGHDGQIGLEQTPDEFVAKLVEVFREVRRVLRDDGTVWLNLGDSYAGASAPGKWREGSARTDGEVRADGNSRRNRNGTGAVRGVKSKELIGIPWRVAFALQQDGWYLRQDIIWHKPNPMPESMRDRCTKAHEYLFLLSKGPRYYFDHEAIKERAVGGCSDRGASFKRDPGGKRSVVHPGQNNATHRPDRPDVSYNGKTRNRRSVWSVPTRAFKGAHFATFPPDLIEPCVLAGCPVGGVVLDPFGGAGTTGLVAQRHGRGAILCELNPEYADMARQRIEADLAPAKPKRAARAVRPAQLDLLGVSP